MEEITTVDLVLPENAIEIWYEVKDHLKSANDFNDGRVPLYHWLARVLGCTADFYVASDYGSACICEIIQYPAKWVYLIVLYGGSPNHLELYKKPIKERATKIGCSQLEVRGRPGWKKHFNQWGAELLHCHWKMDI